MSSFFQKLHGIPSSSVVTTTKVRQVKPQSRSKKPTVETVSQTVIARQGSPHVKLASVKPIITNANHVGSPRRSEASSLRAEVLPMRRTQSSTTTPVSKKRKAPPLTPLKNASTRDVSLSSTPAEVKRRRTASPSYRVHRSSSDDETDFSEPVKLFRGETPDVAQHPPVERSMLNPRAGEDVEFMHAKELVCVVDKESFVAETPENPALEVVVKLPYGEERYVITRSKLI